MLKCPIVSEPRHNLGNNHLTAQRYHINTENRDAYLQSLASVFDRNCDKIVENIVKYNDIYIVMP